MAFGRGFIVEVAQLVHCSAKDQGVYFQEGASREFAIRLFHLALVYSSRCPSGEC